MNCQELLRMNTQVVTEPVYALTAQIPWEFQCQLPLVCDLPCGMMSCYFFETRAGAIYIVALCRLHKPVIRPSNFNIRQAVNPCRRHGFKACRGLCPQTPGCIPTLVLAALHPNISVGCAAS